MSIVLFRAAGAHAQTADHADFEAEMFGAETSTVVESRAVDEAEMFGGGGADETDAKEASAKGGLLDALRSSLDAASDRLALGGNLFLRLEYRAQENGGRESFPLVSANTLDLYLDARPIDRVRTYVRARLAYDPSVREDGQDGTLDPASPTGLAARASTEVFLDQLWLKFDLAQRVFLTVGKQRVRWGTGRIWNPTDFLNAQRFDPLALFDPRLGVGLVKVHVPFESAGANVYGILNLDSADQLDRLGVALRAELAGGQTEGAVSASWRSGEPLRLGADLSTGLGDFELRAELAVLYDVPAPFFSGSWDPERPTELGSLMARYRDEAWIPQLVVGLDYTLGYGDGDQLIIGLEYFFNDAGYPSAELYPILLAAPTLGPALGLRTPVPNVFQPLYLGQHYASAFLLLPAPFSWDDHTFALTSIANISDRSAVLRLDHTYRLFRFLSFRSYVNVHLGDSGEFRFGLDLNLPGATGGLSIPPPLMEVGVALAATL